MLVRARGQGAYWRRVVTHSLAGNLQAVLDEYAHVLVEWLGLTDANRKTSPTVSPKRCTTR
jgi:hypothetical protein